jgi:hypothetical protein
MESLAKSLQLTIDGCRRLLKERNDPREVELVRQVLATAEVQLEEVKRQQNEK